MKPVSFFDDETAKNLKKIWVKPNKGQETIDKIKNTQLKSTWMKKTKKSGKTKQRVFLIDDDSLYMCKSEKTDKISGVLELCCVKLDLLVSVEPKPIEASCSEPLFGFRMCRNGKTLEIYTKDQNLYKKWKNILIYKAIQSTFHEEFIVTKMIGKGSFAKVYLATKKENGQQYAIKAFNKEFMAGQHKGKESLVNEIGIMRNLHSEFLINLYEVYETTNSIYFVVDLLNGGELLHRVRDKGTINEQDLRNLMRNLLSALYHLHQKGIMHRDLKPENLLLKSKSNDHDIVVADFGLATFTDIKDILFKRCGTPGFVAPEVLLYKEGDPFYDVKCDIFSAGIIFYLLLVGKQPFQGKDYKQILRANKACEIRYDTPEFDSISAQAKDLLKKMLEPKPTNRISASECLNHPFINGGEVVNNDLPATQNLRNYEVDYLANVRNKNGSQDSQDMLGSLQLHSNTPAMNGRTDTVGSLSTCSNSNIPPRPDKGVIPLSSKFSKPRSESIDLKNNPVSADNSPKSAHKKSESKNLHKLAIKNNMYRGYQEERKDQEYYEDSDDVSEENSPLSDSLNKMNFEKQMKHTPSKCEELGGQSSPTSYMTQSLGGSPTGGNLSNSSKFRKK
ncbi:Serine/Threonine kinase domain protein (macronuclear) [Tetrahymena thermophila SB210]|uniref:Serine/Threonine kinase domain protein n=1 Tax=Tetrahymena thermophila (strain SB210) TaxID=312017 RepID=I7MJ92_TETTS|nr:Serine/Threonine kinase domain protein [Tetrahymena thermophila SB210]EAS06002.1 Serine/Threonine kinase domain protein [Tetrahymena thermophila SB210]|eukprot:XP_001026247.1 Serine/Threonine kinase domain protein [Tetrahymena thermophila SB210]